MRAAPSRDFGSVSSPATPLSSIHPISFAPPPAPKGWFTALTYIPSPVRQFQSGRPPAAARDRAVVETIRTQRPRRRALEEDIGAGQQAAQQILSRRATDIESHALLAGVVPPVVETAVGIDRVVDEGAAPAPRASRRRLDLDHARAAVGQELARPLVAAIGQLDHGESVVHAIHLRLLHARHDVAHRGRCSSNTTRSALKPVRTQARSLSSQAEALSKVSLR